MELPRHCQRCGGKLMYSIEETLEGSCVICGRPAFRTKVDRTPPEVAELVENSLVRLDRRYK